VPTEIEAKATHASLGSFAIGRLSDFSLRENRKLRPPFIVLFLVKFLKEFEGTFSKKFPQEK
jgi:hypothetical protein